MVPLPQALPHGKEATPNPLELPCWAEAELPGHPVPGGSATPYLVGREQDGAQGEARVVGDGGPLWRRLEREGRRWRG